MSDEMLPDSRRERLAHGRSGRRRTTVVAVCAVALVGGAGAFWAIGHDSEAGAGPTPTTRASTTVTSQPAKDLEAAVLQVQELPAGRPLNHDDPLRLWIGGDSLAGGMGPALGQYAEDSGVVRAVVDFKVSSGLASQVRNWPDRAAEAMDEHDPEAVVFMIGTNDASIVSSNDAAWEPDYREKVQAMMDLLVGGDAHRTVFWVGAPPMRTEWRDRGVQELNRVMQEEALARPDVVFVDGYKIFSSADGDYSADIEIPGAGTVRVRVGDGVHFTPAGAEWIGFNLWKLIDQRWEVGNYADPDLPIDFRTEPGGNAGSGNGSGSGNGNGNGSGNGGATSTSTETTATTVACASDDGTCATTTTIGGEPTTTTIGGEPTTTAPPTTVTPTTTTPTTAPTPTT